MIVITTDADTLIAQHKRTKIQDFAKIQNLTIDRKTVISIQGTTATLVMSWFYNKLYESPDILTRLRTLAVAILGTNGKLSGPTLVETRRSICEGCPLFSRGSTQCRRCTCYMNLKWHIKDMTCPLKKW